jgi:acylglycerol lipase
MRRCRRRNKYNLRLRLAHARFTPARGAAAIGSFCSPLMASPAPLMGAGPPDAAAAPSAPAAPAAADDEVPDLPAHGALWRLAYRVPLLGSLLWLHDVRHCVEPPAAGAPPPADLPPGSAFFRSATTGRRVHYRTWAAAPGVPAKGAVYLLHGYAEHCGRYAHVGAALAARGYSVRALDHQGCGLSEGDRSYVQFFADYVADALQLARTVAPSPPGLPRFLLGHSMGGLMALHVAHADPALWTGGLALSGPGLVIDPKVDTPFNRFMARTLAGVLPKLQVQPLDTGTLCTDAAVVAAYKADPLVFHGALRVRVGYEYIRAVEAVHAWAGELALPLLIVHGEADVLCNPSGSEWLMGAATGCADKTLRKYPGLFHEVFNEPVGLDIVAYVADWMDAHLEGGVAAGVAAAAGGK